MSDPLRVALAVEGPTDNIVLEAILKALLPDTELVLSKLQPEGSLAFGRTGAGWAGVYRWCRQTASEGDGSVSGSSVLLHHHILIVHVDADVASETYSNGKISDAPAQDLPCDQDCPPPSRTTDALRRVVLNWLGEHNTPSRVVLCTPSKNTEAWVVAAVWPDNDQVQRDDWECRANPAAELRRLPGSKRFTKRQVDYRGRQEEIQLGWPGVSVKLTEAGRFEGELRAAISAKTP